MKTKLLNNLPFKIISVIAAIVLWLIVVNIDDTVETDVFKNLPVTLINTDTLTSQDQTYRIEPGTDKVNVTVHARRTELAKIKSSDFVVTADMQKDLRYDSMVKIEVIYTGNATIDSIEQSRENVLVSIEEKATEEFKVTVDTTGTPSAGLEKGTVTPEKSLVEISGPKSVVEQVKKVVASVNINGITGTSVLNCRLKLTNSDGVEIDDYSQLEYEWKDKDFSVTVTTLKSKVVGIGFDISKAAPEGYGVASVSYKPETVTIAGGQSDIRPIYNLNIPPEALNPEGKTGRIEQTVDISEYLPEDIIIPEEDEHEIVVTMEIVSLETIEYSFTPDQITYTNISDGITVDLANCETLVLPVSGLAADLAGLTQDRIQITADMSGVVRAGNYSVPVMVTISDGDAFSWPSGLEITVHVVSTDN